MDMQWWSDSNGYVELEIPEEAIGDCSHQGSCDAEVEYWTPQINWEGITREAMERSLKEWGAWDDLQTVELKTLQERLVWLACCDLNEERNMRI